MPSLSVSLYAVFDIPERSGGGEEGVVEGGETLVGM